MNEEAVPDLYRLAFIPGAFRCPQCQFALTKTALSVATGEIGTTEDNRQSEPCPNDGTMMVHVTYREALSEYTDRLKEELDNRDVMVQALKEASPWVILGTCSSERHPLSRRNALRSLRLIHESLTKAGVESGIRTEAFGEIEADVKSEIMWKQFLAPAPPVLAFNPELPTAIICDIDGTVAKMNGRSPYDYSQVHTDLPYKHIIELIGRLRNFYRIIFVSGRKAECREATMDWLCAHIGFTDPLFMRADGDNRDDRIVKEEIYRREIEGKFNVLLVLDDRDRVVAMWRSLGIPCLQVAEGNF